MDPKPPEGSRITVTSNGDGRLIVMPYASGGVTRYFTGAFILLWLAGWVLGLMSATTILSFGKGGGFLLFWLGGWVIGGVFAAYYAYRIFRLSVPESLLLTLRSVKYDSGIAPVQLQFSGAHRDRWESTKSFFAKRPIVDIDARQ